MSRNVPRRAFLGGVGAMAGATMTGGMAAADEGKPAPEVRYEWLKPAEADQAIADCPTLFQPLGTIEWHGLHNCVGVDAMKAHALCCQAAQRGGGIVAPALYGGVGGVAQPHTFVMESENDVFSNLLRAWVEKLCKEAVRNGFKAVIILTGHYGAAQQIVVREMGVRMTRALGVPVLGTPEYWLALDEGYHGDHAAWGETSLMMHLYPETVDLDRLGDPPHQGVGGLDPKEHASAEDGRRLAEAIINRLATLSTNMPTWDAETIRQFAEAEAAIVGRQLTMAGESGNSWRAWRHVKNGTLDAYPQLLVEEKFDEVKGLAELM